MPDFPASLVEFQRQFPNDDACAAWLGTARWPSGFRCPACAGAKGWPHGGKPFTFECAACGKQTSVTAGTIMHGSKLPLIVSFCRVGGDVAIPTPHRPGRAGFPHPVLHGRVSLAAAYPWRILTGGSGCRASSSLKRVHGTTP